MCECWGAGRERVGYRLIDPLIPLAVFDGHRLLGVADSATGLQFRPDV